MKAPRLTGPLGMGCNRQGRWPQWPPMAAPLGSSPAHVCLLRCYHLRCRAACLYAAWEAKNAAAPCVTPASAGLLMYLEKPLVESLLQKIAGEWWGALAGAGDVFTAVRPRACAAANQSA